MPPLNSDRETNNAFENFNVSFVDFVNWIQARSGIRIGSEHELDKQVVRFVCNLDYSFPKGEIAKWESGVRQDTGVLTTNFFGLFGAGGVLPEHYTERIKERNNEKDNATFEFFGIFNHRLLTMFYLVWEKHRLLRSLESETLGIDSLKRRKTCAGRLAIGSVAGQSILADPPGVLGEDVGLFFSGLFARPQATAQSIQDALACYLDLNVKIETFVGQWLPISPSDRSRLEYLPFGQDSGNRLGINTIIGERSWDRQNKFRIAIGPIPWSLLHRFFPQIGKTVDHSDRALSKVFSLVRRLAGPQWDFDVQVLLESTEVQGVRLDKSFGFHLGWNTWLGKPEGGRVLDHVLFSDPVIAKI
jgi:type VI secretion system protein ImpH